jgi:hypothetical protein
VQDTVSPPPEKPLAWVRLCINGRAAVFTPNIKLTLRVPRVTSSAVPVAGDSVQVSATKSNAGEGADKLEVEVLMEADDDRSSDGEDGLARRARRQEAGMLEEYEEDNQRLPGDEDYESEDDEDGRTSEEMDIIHDAEWLAQQQDEEASDSEDGSDDDDESDESSDEDDEGDADFVPKLRLKRKSASQNFRLRETSNAHKK